MCRRRFTSRQSDTEWVPRAVCQPVRGRRLQRGLSRADELPVAPDPPDPMIPTEGSPSMPGPSPRYSKLQGLMLAMLILAPGCVTTQSWINTPEASTGICQVHTYWESRIQVTQDVVNGGRPLPGLAGRLYLFGPEIKFPEKGDGNVVVDLYDLSGARPEPKASTSTTGSWIAAISTSFSAKIKSVGVTRCSCPGPSTTPPSRACNSTSVTRRPRATLSMRRRQRFRCKITPR